MPKTKTKDDLPKIGRPELPEDERRSASVRAGLTIDEKIELQQNAAIAGLSESEFIRRRLCGFRIAAAPRTAFDPGLIMEVNELGRQVKAVGNLANQLALSVHRGRKFSGDWTRVRDKVNEALDEVTAALRRLTNTDDS